MRKPTATFRPSPRADRRRASRGGRAGSAHRRPGPGFELGDAGSASDWPAAGSKHAGAAGRHRPRLLRRRRRRRRGSRLFDQRPGQFLPGVGRAARNTDARPDLLGRPDLDPAGRCSRLAARSRGSGHRRKARPLVRRRPGGPAGDPCRRQPVHPQRRRPLDAERHQPRAVAGLHDGPAGHRAVPAQHQGIHLRLGNHHPQRTQLHRPHPGDRRGPRPAWLRGAADGRRGGKPDLRRRRQHRAGARPLGEPADRQPRSSTGRCRGCCCWSSAWWRHGGRRGISTSISAIPATSACGHAAAGGTVPRGDRSRTRRTRATIEPVPAGRRWRLGRQGPIAILGLEIDPPTTGWPPSVADVDWLDLGFIDDRSSRHRVVEHIRQATCSAECRRHRLLAGPDAGSRQSHLHRRASAAKWRAGVGRAHRWPAAADPRPPPAAGTAGRGLAADGGRRGGTGRAGDRTRSRSSHRGQRATAAAMAGLEWRRRLGRAEDRSCLRADRRARRRLAGAARNLRASRAASGDCRALPRSRRAVAGRPAAAPARRRLASRTAQGGSGRDAVDSAGTTEGQRPLAVGGCGCRRFGLRRRRDLDCPCRDRHAAGVGGTGRRRCHRLAVGRRDASTRSLRQRPRTSRKPWPVLRCSPWCCICKAGTKRRSPLCLDDVLAGEDVPPMRSAAAAQAWLDGIAQRLDRTMAGEGARSA